MFTCFPRVKTSHVRRMRPPHFTSYSIVFFFGDHSLQLNRVTTRGFANKDLLIYYTSSLARIVMICGKSKNIRIFLLLFAFAIYTAPVESFSLLSKLNNSDTHNYIKTSRRFPTGMFMRRISTSNNEALIASLERAGVMKGERTKAAMRSVDRGNYAPHDPYTDSPQYLGHGVTISAPHMHASVLDLLSPVLEGEDVKILDVGVGSGYLAATFARYNPQATVVGIDIIPELVQLSRENIAKADSDILSRVKILLGNGWEGCPSEAPFDAIHVGAAAATLPRNLLRQLKIGGRMICPIGPEGGYQKLCMIERKMDDEFDTSELMGVQYVPLVKK